MSTELPKVSVVIPCRNEEKFIGACLETLAQQTYPKERLEILVVDGASEDKTRDVVLTCQQKYPFIKLLKNPKRITPISMNIGITNATGEIITIFGAHTRYPMHYLETCVKYLQEYGADVVGGVTKAVPARDTLAARAIAGVRSSFFGAGSTHFQTSSSKPRWADTVFGACYRREVFAKVGLMNEKLVRSQDMELNVRLRAKGGKILVVPELVISYYPKSTFNAFWKHNIADGIWAVLPVKFGGAPLKFRHLAPLFLVLAMVGSAFFAFFYPAFLPIPLVIIGAYLAASLYFSIGIALQEHNIALIPFLIIAFALRHFGYGIGSLLGLVKLVL